MRFITHNKKRYEITKEETVLAGDLVVDLDTMEVFTIVSNRMAMRVNTFYWLRPRVLKEVPIFTEHTLSSILLKSNRLVNDKRDRSVFNRIRLTAEDFPPNNINS